MRGSAALSAAEHADGLMKTVFLPIFFN